jgi:thioesterase domain-containing protein
MTVLEVTRYLHDQIPLSRHLAATVERYDGQSIRLSAPLEPNLNHQSTAFGGSQSALAILSGWALLHLNLRDRAISASLVIQRSTIDFREPIEGAFSATSTLPDVTRWERFLATLARHRRARLAVAADIECGALLSGTHEGVYVAALQLDARGSPASRG